jgi:hypothetical protein
VVCEFVVVGISVEFFWKRIGAVVFEVFDALIFVICSKESCDVDWERLGA